MSDTTPGCRVSYSRSGNSGDSPVSLVHARWGAGADPGHYHVFMCGADLWSLGGGFSLQCVVDDFGTLVNPDSGRLQ